MKIKVILFALFCLIFDFSLAKAYHPLITDDAGTQGKGKFQYELSSEYGCYKAKGVKTKKFSLVNTLTYGFTDSIDIGIGLPYLYWKEEENDESGFSDIEFSIKYRFYEKKGLNLAIKPSITVPTGDEERGLGAGRSTGRIFLILDKELKDFTFFFNAGYIRNENKIGERKDLWHLSLASECKIKKDFKVAGNIALERNPDRTSPQENAFLIIGAVYSFSEAFDLSAGIKKGFRRPEKGLSVTAGLTLRF